MNLKAHIHYYLAVVSYVNVAVLVSTDVTDRSHILSLMLLFVNPDPRLMKATTEFLLEVFERCSFSFILETPFSVSQ